jgi:hypothetical protein
MSTALARVISSLKTLILVSPCPEYTTKRAFRTAALFTLQQFYIYSKVIIELLVSQHHSNCGSLDNKAKNRRRILNHEVEKVEKVKDEEMDYIFLCSTRR